MRGPLVQLRRNRRSFIGGLTAAVLATVLLAVPALAAGTLGLTPSQGVSGDGFQVSGGGFEASEKVKLKWDGKGFGSPVRTDADGAFTTTRSVPVDAPPGKYIVSATGLQSGLKAEAIFTVIEPAATTTTTTTTSPSTTTTVGETTTTAAVGETTTTAAVGETTSTAPDGETTSTAADGKTSSIAADGETTSTAADGETTTTVADGKTTKTDSNTTTDKAGWLVAADDNSTGTGFEFFDNSGLGDVLITPIGLASAVGVPLFGVLAVWWMWRRPSDDEEESSEFGD
ncbi:MAG: hypothetical protein IH818_13590 [Acidobacteria bacterium]|nr:hypothetical protein [Acidobacteriota bacterium]